MSVRHLSLGVFYILQPKINFQELAKFPNFIGHERHVFI